MYFIKERNNPQTGIYYILMGKLPAKEAKKHETSLYGFNTMLRYKTKSEYDLAILVLKESNARIVD